MNPQSSSTGQAPSCLTDNRTETKVAQLIRDSCGCLITAKCVASASISSVLRCKTELGPGSFQTTWPALLPVSRDSEAPLPSIAIGNVALLYVWPAQTDRDNRHSSVLLEILTHYQVHTAVNFIRSCFKTIFHQGREY